MVALFVIGTIVVSVLVQYFLQRSKERRTGLAPSASRTKSADRFLIPRGYFFNRGHAWMEILFSGNARIGIDDFVQKIVGDITDIDVLPVGAEVEKGKTLFSIHKGNRVLSFSAPVSGRIVELNTALLKSPSLIKDDPYFQGWVVMIQPRNIASEIRLLKVADEAADWLKVELRRFRDFITADPAGGGVLAGATMHDGGMPMRGVLEHADPQVWDSFQQQFLSDNNH